MDLSKFRNRNYLWPGIAIAVVLFFIFTLVALNLLGITGDSNVARVIDSSKRVADKKDIEQNITAVHISMSQSMENGAAVRAALADGKNRIIIGH